MTTEITVEDVEFRFGESWTVLKYDDSREYQDGIRKLNGVWKTDKDGNEHRRGCKGVDILGSREGVLTFIEVKDFRKTSDNPTSRIRDELPLEVAFKACDTVAGVVGRAREPGAVIFRGFAKLLVDAECPVEVILWLEEPLFWLEEPLVPPCAVSLRRKALLSTATSKLKRYCRWLTDRVLVVNREEYGHVLGDLNAST